MATVCVCGGTRASVYGRIRWGRTQVPQCESPGFGLLGGHSFSVQWHGMVQKHFHSFFYTRAICWVLIPVVIQAVWVSHSCSLHVLPSVNTRAWRISHLDINCLLKVFSMIYMSLKFALMTPLTNCLLYTSPSPRDS